MTTKEAIEINTKVVLNSIEEIGGVYGISSFYGGNGVGTIENIKVENELGTRGVESPNETLVSGYTVNKIKGQIIVEETELTLTELIEELSYEILNEKYPDWESGSGCFGEIIFDIENRSFEVHYHIDHD
jgi:hypothetical protein